MVLKVIHNGAFTSGADTSGVLASIDFGSANQLTVMDEPTGPSPYQTTGNIYDTSSGDYEQPGTSIGIFSNQTKLKTVDFHQSYYGDDNANGDNTPTLLNIPANAFRGCSGLTSLQGGRDINYYKGLGASSVTSMLAIPDSVKSIGDNAFDGVNPQILIFPSSLEKLGNDFLGNSTASNLKDVIFSNPVCPD
jgi:hypothetical protein